MEGMKTSFADFHDRLCGTSSSPVMRAILLASEGALVNNLHASLALMVFGCNTDDLPQQKPRIVCVRKGGRSGGTSRLLVPRALYAAMAADLGRLSMAGSAVIVTHDPAQVVGYCKDYIREDDALRASHVSSSNQEFEFRRGDGSSVFLSVVRHEHEVKEVAHLFIGFDDANDTMKSLDCLSRLSPGAQLWAVSDAGLDTNSTFDGLVSKEHGFHRNALVAIARTRWLNPSWDPMYEIEDKLRLSHPAQAMREIDAVPLSLQSVLVSPPPPKESEEESLRKSIALSNLRAEEKIASMRLKFAEYADRCATPIAPGSLMANPSPVNFEHAARLFDRLTASR